MDKKNTRIVFMGTPDFAVEVLKVLVENDYHVVGVITVPDRPAGRGQKIIQSTVKKYALANNLNVLQPEKLKNELFISELKALKPDIQVVVAFRMLPEVVWRIPTHGTFNLHASLLPQYRGAAPINWAVINGEKESGVTTFFIDDKIDTGNIIFCEKVDIDEDETAGELHDKLMHVGSRLVLKTIDSIIKGDCPRINQNELFDENTILKPAPKLSKEECKINWNKSISDIYNFIRGLSPYPAAFTYILNNQKIVLLKVFKADKLIIPHSDKLGTIVTDGKMYLHIAVDGGYINIMELQQAGKKRMKVEDFLRGFNQIHEYQVEV